jgi:hypothetical protein
MKIHIDKSFNKSIVIPLEIANDNAINYKHLHCKTMVEYQEIEGIEDVQIYYAGKKNKPLGIVVIYENVLKPNTPYFILVKS